MSETMQITLAQSENPECVALRKQAAELLRDRDPGQVPVRRLTGVTTPQLAAYRTWRRPHEEGAEARLRWAERIVRSSTETDRSGGGD